MRGTNSHHRHQRWRHGTRTHQNTLLSIQCCCYRVTFSWCLDSLILVSCRFVSTRRNLAGSHSRSNASAGWIQSIQRNTQPNRRALTFRFFQTNTFSEPSSSFSFSFSISLLFLFYNSTHTRIPHI